VVCAGEVNINGVRSGKQLADFNPQHQRNKLYEFWQHPELKFYFETAIFTGIMNRYVFMCE